MPFFSKTAPFFSPKSNVGDYSAVGIGGRLRGAVAADLYKVALLTASRMASCITSAASVPATLTSAATSPTEAA